MIGAEISVFLGIATGDAGSAVALSFAIGGVIALFVALPASELATATIDIQPSSVEN
jgi:amino acid transporter